VSSTFVLPLEAINCRPGDYLLKQEGPSRWRVLLVEGFALLEPLLPLGSRESREFIEEQHVRDSERPPLVGQIQLLVTWFHPTFESEGAAQDAVDRAALGDQVPGVHVEAGACTRETTRVYQPGHSGS
jgi:hypothetical protein